MSWECPQANLIERWSLHSQMSVMLTIFFTGTVSVSTGLSLGGDGRDAGEANDCMSSLHPPVSWEEGRNRGKRGNIPWTMTKGFANLHTYARSPAPGRQVDVYPPYNSDTHIALAHTWGSELSLPLFVDWSCKLQKLLLNKRISQRKYPPNSALRLGPAIGPQITKKSLVRSSCVARYKSINMERP